MTDFKEKIKQLNLEKNPSPPLLPKFKVAIRSKVLAKTVNLRSVMPPIYDQGDLGSCVSNATSACISYAHYKRTGKYFSLSRLFNYFTGRGLLSLEDNDPSYLTADSGLYIHTGFDAVKKYGAVAETGYVYNISKFAYLPPVNIFTSAAGHNKVIYSSVDKILINIKNILASKQPIAIGILVYENFFNDNTGNIPMPAGDLLGGHAIVLTGYDDTKNIFHFRNSWGTGWGNGGYGTIPYNYIMGDNAFDLITVNSYIF
jgi:C1A family cysteine protease